jgi:hypothetical protein
VPLRVGPDAIVPHGGAGEHVKVHVTPLPDESLTTVGVIETVPVASTLMLPLGSGAGLELREILTDGTVMVTVTDLVESSTEVAVTVTVKSLAGGVEGAL